MYKYKFTIITAVYNVEPFLDECIESVLKQDIGFEKNIQFILIDDGSTDKSGEICDKYAKQYPNNILVIHKENGGVSSARNEGIKYAEGKYINFLDADDKLAIDASRKVEKFFDRNENLIDIVAIPMYFFGKNKNEHILNYKFKDGNRVINLKEEYKAILLSLSSAFVKYNAIKNLRFDINLKYAEDAKVCIEIMSQKFTLGVVEDTKYFYRRRECGESSAVEKAILSPNYYLPYIENFVENIISKFKNGDNIPKFIQYTLLYHLQWKLLLNEKTVRQVLSEDEYIEYRNKLINVVSYFDDDIILKQNNIYIEHKAFLLSLKYNKKLGIKINNNIAEYYIENTFIGTVNDRNVILDFINIRNENLIIEGCITYLKNVENSDIQIAAIVNNNITNVDMNFERQLKSTILGEACLKTINFKLSIPVNHILKSFQIRFVSIINGKPIEHKHIITSKFFPIGKSNNKAFCIVGNYLFTINENRLDVQKYNLIRHICKEIKYLKYLLSSKEIGAKKAACIRILYYNLKPFMNKDIWLLSDRINKADDNGEALFKYLHDNKINQKRYFVISKRSNDYQNIQKYGSVLDYYSLKHRMLHLFAKKIVSSAGDDYVFCPFWNNAVYFRDLMYGQKRIFLQHGITKDDISGWLNRYSKNLDIFITCAKPEYNSIITGNYYYDNNIVKLTGFARYDRLYDEKKKIITIMPTWRKNLITAGDYSRTGEDIYDRSFFETEYFKFYNSLINNQKLLTKAREKGYIIKFMPHPRIIPYVNEFDIQEGVEFCNIETKYRDIFAESNLIVTDYSSVAFDFAYLKKPVIYAQFDNKTFFENHTYDKGYFDYERDGFGEVEYTLDAIIERIIEYLNNDCKVKSKYLKRMEAFFAFNDKNNCKRIYEVIKKLE